MVSATSNPRLLRVQYDRLVNDVSKNSIVCYLWAAETGVKIYYAGHLMYSRPIPKGPWEGPKFMKQTLGHTLQAEIFTSVFKELWDRLVTELRVLPFPGDHTDKPEDYIEQL